MSSFNQFTKMGLTHTIAVIGEPASIGGNQFNAAFNESGMNVIRHMYGDEDEVTTSAVCIKSELTNEPRVGETLIRINQRKTYVITEVQSDIESYDITMRAKDA
jgi:hypothetical protein